MNIKKSNDVRKSYISPAIETITLDNEISLALESAPPYGPDEDVDYGFNGLQDSKNPMKDYIA